MPGWIPRWHPLIWLFVIIVIFGIITAPAAMGADATGIIAWGEHAIKQLFVFFQSIHSS